MDLEFKRKERVVGVFLLVICLLVIISLFLLGRGKGWFKNYIEYYAVFDEAYNLQEGAPVKLYNAEIGKIDKIELVEDDVKVVLLIVDEFQNRIRETSYVTVKSPTLIGSEYISLVTLDKVSNLIPEGQQIPSVEKKSFSDIMAEFQVEQTAKKFVEAVQNLSEMADKLNSDDGPVFSILYDLQRIVDDIEKGKGNIGELIRTDKITREISGRLAQVEEIMEEVKKAVSQTPYTMNLVNKNLERVDRIGGHVEESSESLTLLIKKLSIRIDDIKAIIDNIEKGSKDVPHITKTTLDGIQEIRESVKKADDALKALQKSFLIRGNLPQRKLPGELNADVRP